MNPPPLDSTTIERFHLACDCVQVTWHDGRQSDYHYIWLRDNCPSVWHPTTRERTFDSMQIDPNIKPIAVDLSEGGELMIQWPEDLTSLYDPIWLRKHSYDTLSRAERRPQSRYWDGESMSKRSAFDAATLMVDDCALLQWLLQLRDEGFAQVRQVPLADSAVEELAGRIAYCRQTNFGVGFEVISKPDANNVAYTALELKAHTDLPNREMPPGIQFLHCVEESTGGGESFFVDGFYAADQLRQVDPEAFALLSTTAVPFRFHDAEWDLRWKAPVIELDYEGEVAEIRYHNALMAPLDVAADLVRPMYRALQTLTTILREPSNVLQLRLHPGDLVAFHNRRVLHGRSAFNPGSGRRRLLGCYVDMDEFHSRIRVLERPGEASLQERRQTQANVA